MKQFNSKVINLKEVANDYYCLSFTWDSNEIPLAGQFLTIRTTSLSTPLLRRPFALSSYDDVKKIGEIIFKKIGSGTSILSSLKKGDSLDILGPLGNSFLDSQFKKAYRKNHLIVAGGIGTGPMLFLTKSLIAMNIEPLFIIGCRTSTLVPFEVISKKFNAAICTDDGSYGYKGNVIDYLNSIPDISKNSIIYSCGPEPMLKGCHYFSEKNDSICIVSLEETMACGVGACMGCTCKTKGEKKYARICKDGPVFFSNEVKWT